MSEWSLDNIQLSRRIANDPEVTAAIALHEDRIEKETNVVGSVFCNAPRLIPHAEAAGVRPSMFSSEDLQLIYVACNEKREGAPIDALVRAWEKLAAAGYWVAEAAPGSTGTQWSNKTLVAFYQSWPPCSTVVESYAQRLIEAIAREDEIRQLQRRIVGLITGEIGPAPRPTDQIRVTMRVSRPKQRTA